MLLTELKRRGGVAIACTSSGAGPVRVALLADGTAMLRFGAPPTARSAAIAVTALGEIAARLATAAATLAGLRALADLAVAAVAVVVTGSVFLGDAGRDRLPALVLGAGAAMLALRLRRPVLRRVVMHMVGGRDA